MEPLKPRDKVTQHMTRDGLTLDRPCGGSRRVYHRMPVRMGGFPDGSFEKALAAGTKIPGHYHSDKGGIF